MKGLITAAVIMAQTVSFASEGSQCLKTIPQSLMQDASMLAQKYCMEGGRMHIVGSNGSVGSLPYGEGYNPITPWLIESNLASVRIETNDMEIYIKPEFLVAYRNGGIVFETRPIFEDAPPACYTNFMAIMRGMARCIRSFVR
jgi:hypothetical protein